ncbi:MAG: RNA-binding S4 domain-containing protein [Brevinema sp.]
MRLDKWLKVSLIYKQRTKANNAIDNNRIRVNGELAKASRNLKIGDIIMISKELGDYYYTVLNLFEKNVTRELAREMYSLQAPEETGTEDEKAFKVIEREQRKENRKNWNKMYDDKKKQRQLRSHKYD